MSQRMRRASTGIVGGAALIAVVTLVARVFGFGRTVAMGQSLGASCLGSAYTSANAVPNLVFEIVVGGALAGAVVPLLAGAVERGNRDLVSGTVRALTGWVLVLLVPAALLCALLADPIVGVLLGAGGGCDQEELRNVAASMLRVFALQIPIYGLTVVAQGALNSHHRFFAPAVAPLVSSVVVIAVFVLYGAQAGADQGSITALSSGEFALLAWGTTLGVLTLWLTQLPSLARTGLLFLRPALRFPEGVGPRARRLAAAGFVTVSAQWLAFVIGLRLANEHGSEGSALVYTVAWTVFLLPWAVLAYPIATSAFPRLASQYDHEREQEFTKTTAGTLRAVVAAGLLGVAGVVATSGPVADLMLNGAPGDDATEALQQALVWIAPAVLGYAVLGQVSRVLYARHRGAGASWLVGGGWLTATAAAWWLTDTVEPVRVVSALGGAASLGMLLAGAASLVVVHRVVGGQALSGLMRTGGGGLLAAVVAAGGGLTIARLLETWSAQGGLSTVSALLAAALVSVVVAALFVAVMMVVARDDLRSMAHAVRSGRHRDATKTPHE
jgi:murein biosynthesis integral membrane protein MurJ